MKVPSSVRDLYGTLRPQYVQLEVRVGELLRGKKADRWHYEGRIKDLVSFALKLETGRVDKPGRPDDLFACTLVVENHSRIADAEKLAKENFTLVERKPHDPHKTFLEPFVFNYDDLRLYVTWKDLAEQKHSGLTDLLFEIQIKTFLQHAWAIATHDLVYKTDEISWAKSRIAFQAKAMLENTELSISEAKRLTDAALLAKEDKKSAVLKHIIEELCKRWTSPSLPKDRRRLAQNVLDLCTLLQIKHQRMFEMLDRATEMGQGAEMLDLSPYGAILASMIREKGASLFDPLKQEDLHDRLFVPREVQTPDLPAEVELKLIRT